MPWRSRSIRVWRVFSQATRSTSRSTRSARSVTSSRLPIGVATTKRVPGGDVRLRRLPGAPTPPAPLSLAAPNREHHEAGRRSRPERTRLYVRIGDDGERPLRRLFLGFRDEDRLLVAQDHLAGDHALLEPLDRGQLVHDLEHHLFQDGAKAAGPGTPLERFLGDGGDGVVGELEPHLFEVEVLLVLLDDRVLRLLED